MNCKWTNRILQPVAVEPIAGEAVDGRDVEIGNRHFRAFNHVHQIVLCILPVCHVAFHRTVSANIQIKEYFLQEYPCIGGYFTLNCRGARITQIV